MAERRGTIALVENAVDPGELSPSEVKSIARNHVGEIEIAVEQPIAADLYAVNPRTGRLVLELNGRIAGGGLILAVDDHDAANGPRPAAPVAIKPDLDTPGRQRLAVQAAQLNVALAELAPAARLARFRGEVDGRLVFTTSFGLEDQVIAHLICTASLDYDIVTIDTGRLFPETYNVWAETERRYGRRIRALAPRHDALEALIDKVGINGFYQSRDARVSCCHVRKIEPLDRALGGAAGWAVGLRADQSAHRRNTALVEVDPHGLLKLSPLFDWNREAVQAFAEAHDVPVNPLHREGFVSLGCAPCTRAIATGEPERAGRWWWEADDKKECGLHIRGGRVVRVGGA